MKTINNITQEQELLLELWFKTSMPSPRGGFWGHGDPLLERLESYLVEQGLIDKKGMRIE